MRRRTFAGLTVTEWGRLATLLTAAALVVASTFVVPVLPH